MRTGERLQLRRHNPQGINPAILLLELIVQRSPFPDGPATHEERVIDVEPDAGYTSVTILPDGPTVPVELRPKRHKRSGSRLQCLRSRGGEHECQRLGVGAGAQRDARADRLTECERRHVTGDRAAKHAQRGRRRDAADVGRRLQ